MTKRGIGRLAALLFLLLLTMFIFVVVPVLIGVRTHKYLYHLMPHNDPLRFFKGITSAAMVVVTTVFLLSVTIGRPLQLLLKRVRGNLQSEVIGEASMLPLLQTNDVVRSGGEEARASWQRERERRVLEEILESEEDEVIRQTIEDALRTRYEREKDSYFSTTSSRK